jgi:hypothetical protein
MSSGAAFRISTSSAEELSEAELAHITDSIYHVQDSFLKSGHWSNTKQAGDVLVRQYDSAINSLPEGSRPGFFERALKRRDLHRRAVWVLEGPSHQVDLGEWLKHSFPQILFVSLPLFALLLELLYIRRRKELYYTSHGIFAIHLYCATFLLLLISMLLLMPYNVLHLSHRYNFIVRFLTAISIFTYQWVAMRRYYHQGVIKTTFKFLVLNFAALIMMMILLFIYTLAAQLLH